jgi:uncharacterized protein YcfL
MKKSILLILAISVLTACASNQNFKIVDKKPVNNSSDKLDAMMIQTMQMRDSYRNF